MKLSSILLWSSLLAPLAPQAWAQANTLPSQPHLLVKGQAQREVMPDRFTLQLAMDRVDRDADLARSKVEQDVARALALFKAHHAVDGSVRADNLVIAPATEYQNNRQTFIGTRVGRELRGSFARIADMQAFLGALQANENVQVSSLSPSYSKEMELRRELKGEAAAQTRRSAQGLAQAYGTRVRGLYSISDVAPSFAYGVQAGTWPATAQDVAEGRPVDLIHVTHAPVPAPAYTRESVEAGPITVTENVYAIFLISDGT